MLVIVELLLSILQEACYPFWPVRLGEQETYGKLLVTLQEEEPGKEYTVRKFEIKDEKVIALEPLYLEFS